MDWSIQEVARLAGTTSRTLRHYGDVGLLEASRIGSNGYRYYDERALVRLQRILLLRDLGLGIPAIRSALDEHRDDARALRTHLDWLHQEKDRLDRQISAVETTILTMEGGEQLMAHDMFDGFDHTVYKEEVEQRWGAEAYADGDRWWRSLTPADKAQWMTRQKQLAADWAAAAAAGLDPRDDEGQRLAQRQADWLGGIPGTPALTKEYFVGLGELYVADQRFAANYGGVDGATFVRDAMRAYAEGNL